jgi:hypothetical protein
MWNLRLLAETRKKKPPEDRRHWLKYLVPALALPFVVIGGLYGGAIILGDDTQGEAAGALSRSDRASAGVAQSPQAAPASPQSSAIPRPTRATGPIDVGELRITDTIVRDGSSEGDQAWLADDLSGPAVTGLADTGRADTGAANAPADRIVLDPRIAAPVPTVSVATATTAASGQEIAKRDELTAAVKPEDTPPLWRRNATSANASRGRPMIAVVIDDLGPNLRNARRTITLPAPLTLAFLSYADHLEDLTSKARVSGHELMLHVPMEPEESSQDPGPNALLTDLAPAENRRRLNWGLARFSGYVGVNNHMGSKFTRSREGMDLVMAELGKRGLLFLDSRTIADSRAEDAAAAFQVPFVERNVFIDNDHENRASIRAQLSKLEALARRSGYAVAIGHPHDETLDVLAKWLPLAEERGFSLVPISEIVQQRLQLVRATAPLAAVQSGAGHARP